jgi:hypothetical protein
MHTVDVPLRDYTKPAGADPTIEITLLVQPFIDVCPREAEKLLEDVIARAEKIIREALAQIDPDGSQYAVFMPNVRHVPLYPCTTDGRLLPDSSYILEALEPTGYTSSAERRLVDREGKVFGWTAWARFQREPALDRLADEIWTLV